MNAEKYIEVLREQLLPEFAASEDDMTFMQDNAPCHTARVVKAFLQENHVPLLEWPPQSPDLNPIETVWAFIQQKLSGYPTAPSGRQELIDRVLHGWDHFPVEMLDKYSFSMIKGM